jgi:hypothetical protein
VPQLRGEEVVDRDRHQEYTLSTQSLKSRVTITEHQFIATRSIGVIDCSKLETDATNMRIAGSFRLLARARLEKVF